MDRQKTFFRNDYFMAPKVKELAHIFPRWLGQVLCFVVALVITAYNWGPLVSAKWSIIDDHELVSLAGPNDDFSFSDIPAALSKTELSPTFANSRFRPSYFILRYSEAALWGANPYRWYATRIAIAFLFAVVLTGLSLYLAGSMLTFGFLIFALSRPYWTDVFARLGPSETYCVLGSCLVVIGLAAGIRRGWSVASCAALAVGIVIAAGSKENFLLLGALALWMLWRPPTQLTSTKKTLFVAVLAYVGWICTTIARRLKHEGQDIYAQDISVGSRVELVSGFLARSDVQIWLALTMFGIMVIMLLRILNHRDNDKAIAQLSHRLDRDAITVLTLLAIFASQYIFYFGHWPEVSSARYLFPGKLGEHLAILLGVAALTKLARFSDPKAIWSWAVPLTATMCFVGITMDDYQKNRLASKNVAAVSNNFTSELGQVTKLLKINSSYAVILESHRIEDYESIFAMLRFIRSTGVANPIAVRITGYSSASFAKNSLSAQLSKTIEDLQNNGGQGFTPLKALNSSQECYSIGLRRVQPSMECKAGIRFDSV